jgi:antitoxin ParD1/3/4
VEIAAMNISLQPDVQRYVDEKIKLGLYGSQQEAVNGLLQHLRSLEELTSDAVDELRAEIDKGIAEADRGAFAEFTAEDIIAQRHAALAAQKKVS